MRKAKIHAERGIVWSFGEGNVILRYRFVIAAERNKNDSKIGMSSDYVGVQPEHFFVFVHRERKVSALLCLRRLLKDLLRIGFLRLRTEGTGRHQDEHKGDEEESARSAHVLKYNLKGRPSLLRLFTVLQGQGSVDLGLRFAPPYWRRVLAAELPCPGVRTAWERLRLKRLGAFVENVASIRALEKVRFRAERRATAAGMDSIVFCLRADARNRS
jgi:hypothetical protein